MSPTRDSKSEVAPPPPLRWTQLRALVDEYARGRISLGRYDRAARAILRRPQDIPMMPLGRAFVVSVVLLILGCGGAMPESPQPAQVAPPAAQSTSCRWLATSEGPRCLPDGRDIFWESDSQPRVTVLPGSVSVETPDDGIRWIFFLSDGDPSVIRQIVLVPHDAFRVGLTRLVIPHPIESVTISLDWFGHNFE